jgi:hypothetical protein
MYRLIIACVLALVAALAGTALTKTPDKKPPSTETACVGLFGAARGLCNAYCQAQDCDVHQRPSCATLRKQFQKQTGSSQFPCDRVACGQSAPACDGDCPTGFVCASGVENGGSEGGSDSISACTCAVPCGEATAPQCAGACPLGTVCSSGAEGGGSEGGSEGGPEGATCTCLVPCGSATAPTCAGACPSGFVCSSGAEGGPEGGGSEGGPEGAACVCDPF